MALPWSGAAVTPVWRTSIRSWLRGEVAVYQVSVVTMTARATSAMEARGRLRRRRKAQSRSTV